MKVNGISTHLNFKSQPRYEISDKFQKDELKKLMNSFQYIDFAYCSETGQVGIIEYDFKNGKKGNMTRCIDGITEKGLSDRAFLQPILDQGYDVDKIKYNNNPARDVFQKSTK